MRTIIALIWKSCLDVLTIFKYPGLPWFRDFNHQFSRMRSSSLHVIESITRFLSIQDQTLTDNIEKQIKK